MQYKTKTHTIQTQTQMNEMDPVGQNPIQRTVRTAHLKPCSERPTQLNSTQLVELSRVGRSEHSDDPTQLNSTG